MQKQQLKQQQHYVFGYGSLTCPDSRAATAQALRGGITADGAETATDGAIPVRLNNWVRLWNTRGPNTYLGVERCRSSSTGGRDTDESENHHSCVGVLVPLPSSDPSVLEALDRRERAYQREKVDLGSIERVDDLLLKSQEELDGGNDDKDGPKGLQRGKQAIHNRYYKDTFLEGWRQPHRADEKEEASGGNYDSEGSATASTDDAGANHPASNNVCVWIYVPLKKYQGWARPENPILQSYVDICIRGCLSISTAFAREFVDGTYGWYPGHFHERPATTEAAGISTKGNDRADNNNKSKDDDDNSEESSSCDDRCCWIDDRNKPVYIRADKEYSLQHSNSLDAVFDKDLLRRRGQC